MQDYFDILDASSLIFISVVPGLVFTAVEDESNMGAKRSLDGGVEAKGKKHSLNSKGRRSKTRILRQLN